MQQTSLGYAYTLNFIELTIKHRGIFQSTAKSQLLTLVGSIALISSLSLGLAIGVDVAVGP